MLLIVVILAAAVATVPLAGGRLGRLADLRLRAAWLLPLAVALQAAASPLSPVTPPRAVAVALHLASYAAVAGALVANRRVPGIALIALGGATNLAAIAANGGVMPASPAALARAGMAPAGGAERFVNSDAVAEPKLAFLGDVFAIPAEWPLANVFSIGDVLIAAGAVVLLHRVCGSRLAARLPRPGRAPA